MTTFTEHDWDAPVPYPRPIGPFDRSYSDREREIAGRSGLTCKETRRRMRSGYIPIDLDNGGIFWLETDRQSVRRRNRQLLAVYREEGIGVALAEADLSFPDTFAAVSQEQHDRLQDRLVRATTNTSRGVNLSLTVAQFNALMKLIPAPDRLKSRAARELHEKVWGVWADLHPEEGPFQ